LIDMPGKPSPATAAALQRHRQRFAELMGELQQLEFFCKGTVLRRMMRCGKAQCACQRDPAKRHGPYFQWTYNANGKTVTIKLTPETAPIYQAAARQYRKLKTALHRLEKLSATALNQHAKLVQSARRRT
jgi:hypothetical protein